MEVDIGLAEGSLLCILWIPLLLLQVDFTDRHEIGVIDQITALEDLSALHNKRYFGLVDLFWRWLSLLLLDAVRTESLLFKLGQLDSFSICFKYVPFSVLRCLDSEQIIEQTPFSWPPRYQASHTLELILLGDHPDNIIGNPPLLFVFTADI